MPDAKDITEIFAAHVKHFRQQMHISQEELADRAGLHRTYVSDVERSARNVTLRSAARIALALGQPLSALLEVHP